MEKFCKNYVFSEIYNFWNQNAIQGFGNAVNRWGVINRSGKSKLWPLPHRRRASFCKNDGKGNRTIGDMWRTALKQKLLVCERSEAFEAKIQSWKSPISMKNTNLNPFQKVDTTHCVAAFYTLTERFSSDSGIMQADQFRTTPEEDAMWWSAGQRFAEKPPMGVTDFGINLPRRVGRNEQQLLLIPSALPSNLHRNSWTDKFGEWRWCDVGCDSGINLPSAGVGKEKYVLEYL